MNFVFSISLFILFLSPSWSQEVIKFDKSYSEKGISEWVDYLSAPNYIRQAVRITYDSTTHIEVILNDSLQLFGKHCYVFTVKCTDTRENLIDFTTYFALEVEPDFFISYDAYYSSIYDAKTYNSNELHGLLKQGILYTYSGNELVEIADFTVYDFGSNHIDKSTR